MAIDCGWQLRDAVVVSDAVKLPAQKLSSDGCQVPAGTLAIIASAVSKSPCVQVERMAKQFNVAEDMAYTCESAGYFWLLHVLSRWERFQSEAQRLKKAECVKVRCQVASRESPWE